MSHRPLQLGIRPLKVCGRGDMFEMHLFDNAETVDERQKIDFAGLVADAGRGEQLLRLRNVGLREEIDESTAV